MSPEPYVPEIGDEVEIVIRGRVSHFGGANRILVVKLPDGRSRITHYNPYAVLPTDAGVRVRVLPRVAASAGP